MNTNFPRLLPALCFALSLAAPALLAQDTVLGPNGGVTGTPFDQRASAGERIAALHVRSGSFVDGLTIDFRNRAGQFTHGSLQIGNTTGSPTDFVVAPSDYLVRVDVWTAIGFVNMVAFETHDGVRQVFGASYPGQVRQNFQLGTQEVVGLVGRAGALLTALGAVARPVLSSHCYFGQGCAGSTGVPILRLRAGSPDLTIGGTAVVEIVNGRPSTLAVVTYGLSTTSAAGLPLPLPLATYGAPGCSVLCSTDAMQWILLNSAGTEGHTAQAPNNAGLIGLMLSFQGVVLDVFANPAHLVTTRAMTSTIGAL